MRLASSCRRRRHVDLTANWYALHLNSRLPIQPLPRCIRHWESGVRQSHLRSLVLMLWSRELYRSHCHFSKWRASDSCAPVGRLSLTWKAISRHRQRHLRSIQSVSRVRHLFDLDSGGIKGQFDSNFQSKMVGSAKNSPPVRRLVGRCFFGPPPPSSILVFIVSNIFVQNILENFGFIFLLPVLPFFLYNSRGKPSIV